MSAGASQWQYIDPFGLQVGMAGRSGVRTPEAQYPDGYLTPMSWKRGRGAADVAPALNERGAYDRGVNKHTKLPPEDYYWPPGYLSSRLGQPAERGPEGVQYVARQAKYGRPEDYVIADAYGAPPWTGTELDRYVNRPPWSP